MIGLAAFLLLAAPAPAAASITGLYEIRQMEMAGGLELRADGHFRYALSYGAVDEQASGDWSFDGRSVRLTTSPAPKRPAFELVHDDPAPRGELYLTLEDPGFEWGHGLEAIAFSSAGEPFEISASEDGRVDLGGRRDVAAVIPLIPVYGPAGERFELARDRGHRLLFRFHRNDLGTAAFVNEPLDLAADGLEMKRYDARIRFIRVRP